MDTQPHLWFARINAGLAALPSDRHPATWIPEIASSDLLPDFNSFSDIRDIIHPDGQSFAPTPFEGMVSVGIGGEAGDKVSLSLQRGLAGALWRASH